MNEQWSFLRRILLFKYLGCCSTFEKLKNTHLAARVFFNAFSKVSQHPARLNQSILQGKPFGIPWLIAIERNRFSNSKQLEKKHWRFVEVPIRFFKIIFYPTSWFILYLKIDFQRARLSNCWLSKSKYKKFGLTFRALALFLSEGQHSKR